LGYKITAVGEEIVKAVSKARADLHLPSDSATEERIPVYSRENMIAFLGTWIVAEDLVCDTLPYYFIR
jgi:hypothetical protein